MQFWIDHQTKTIKALSLPEDGSAMQVNYPIGRPLPEDAPQEVKDLAAQHWTPEVIAAAKEKYEKFRGIPANPISS